MSLSTHSRRYEVLPVGLERHSLGSLGGLSAVGAALPRSCLVRAWPGHKEHQNSSWVQMAVQESQKLVVTLLVIAAW